MSIFNLTTEICLLIGFAISLGLSIHAYWNKILVWWYQRRSKGIYLEPELACWLIDCEPDYLDNDMFGRERFRWKDVGGRKLYSLDDMLSYKDDLALISEGIAVTESYSVQLKFIPKKFGGGQ